MKCYFMQKLLLSSIRTHHKCKSINDLCVTKTRSIEIHKTEGCGFQLGMKVLWNCWYMSGNIVKFSLFKLGLLKNSIKYILSFWKIYNKLKIEYTLEVKCYTEARTSIYLLWFYINQKYRSIENIDNYVFIWTTLIKKQPF